MSLVTTPSSRLGSCASCGGSRITAITMTLTDGSPVDFTSCHSCERKLWQQAGRELQFSSVLLKAQKHRAA